MFGAEHRKATFSFREVFLPRLEICFAKEGNPAFLCVGSEKVYVVVCTALADWRYFCCCMEPGEKGRLSELVDYFHVRS